MQHTIPELVKAAEERINRLHIGCFEGIDTPLFLISDTYPGIWLEHVYDSVFYAKMNPKQLELAVNTVMLFIKNQTPDGQLPFRVMNPAKYRGGDLIGYAQIQECVSFAALCLEVAEMKNDPEFLRVVFEASKKWENWIRQHRMTTNRGLVEMFVGYDTGHDNSGRLAGMAHHGNHVVDGKALNAACLPDDDGITPILAVDMSCNLYGTDVAIAKMAKMLGNSDESEKYLALAAEVKQKLFEHCYDPSDDFFYDVDRNGNKRRFLSSTIFHLFLEKVLDPVEDAELISRIYKKHIKNPNEFWTNYPFPSMAVCDPSTEGHIKSNCWGYFTEGLIDLRCTRWMDHYGFGEDFDFICRKWVEAWTDCFDMMKFGQELDPITGKPSPSSEWYSSCMLFYIYSAKRLGLM